MRPLNTSDGTVSHSRTLLYALHGWGKTTQAKHYKQKYGKGLIISGESGLSSIKDEAIDYIPFTSWDGPVDEQRNIYSFVSIMRWIRSEEFKDLGYKWIMIDSLTELSDLIYAAAKEEVKKKEHLTKGGEVNDFKIWEFNSSWTIAACKFIRDLPMNVIITCLAKESTDDNGRVCYWPMVKGSQMQTQLPGLFDNVFCGIKRVLDGGHVQRYIITDHYKGWFGKARDEKRRLKAVEEFDDVTKLLDIMNMPDDAYEAYLKTKKETVK